MRIHRFMSEEYSTLLYMTILFLFYLLYQIIRPPQISMYANPPLSRPPSSCPVPDIRTQGKRIKFKPKFNLVSTLPLFMIRRMFSHLMNFYAPSQMASTSQHRSLIFRMNYGVYEVAKTVVPGDNDSIKETPRNSPTI
jgi:hypothetical protein